MADPGRWRRTRRALAAPFRSERHFGEVHEAIERLRADLGRVHLELQDDLGRMHRELSDETHANRELLRRVYDDEVANRRRLHELRRGGDYELAFTESEPLVTFIVPTYKSWETLRDVALPSILAQSYSNLEVIVVGDAAPPETGEVVADLGDSRVRYYNRPLRGPYPEDESRRWFVVGSPPYNDGVALARGRWIAGLGDDDAVRPEHTRTLVDAAREHRWEHCYGLHLVHFAEGEPLQVGEFPPRLGEFGLQASIYHAGLTFFGFPYGDALVREPNDWSLCRRMLEAGVRFGMVDAVVADKYESRRRNAEEFTRGESPRAS